MKNLIKVILIVIGILLFSEKLYAQSSPVVSNVCFSISGTLVIVTYDVSASEQDFFTVYMEVSDDGGVTWDYNYGTASGDIGDWMTEGTGKTITWTNPGIYNENFRIKIIAGYKTADGSPCPGTEMVYYEGGPNSDGDGAYYNTILIGNQCWLKENLNVGTMINSTTSGSQQTDNSVIEKYCYDNDPANCEVYGGLYEWNEAMQYVTTGGTQGICPPGWHIPLPAEFQSLQTLIDNSAALIAESQSLTYTPVYDEQPYLSKNATGFSGLFAGRRLSTDGSFSFLFGGAYFWGSAKYDRVLAFSMFLYNHESSVYPTMYGNKANGFSVRCLKDVE